MRRRYRALGLPEGMAVDPHTGRVSGTPTETGFVNVTVLYGTLPAWLRFRARLAWHGRRWLKRSVKW